MKKKLMKLYQPIIEEFAESCRKMGLTVSITDHEWDRERSAQPCVRRCPGGCYMLNLERGTGWIKNEAGEEAIWKRGEPFSRSEELGY